MSRLFEWPRASMYTGQRPAIGWCQMTESRKSPRSGACMQGRHLPTPRRMLLASGNVLFSKPIGKAQIKQIAASIERFGFNNPVLIADDGGIVAGHGRVAAAKLLGIETVPAVRLSHLTEAERRAYVIADC
jgi:ParB-like nuclease domain